MMNSDRQKITKNSYHYRGQETNIMHAAQRNMSRFNAAVPTTDNGKSKHSLCEPLMGSLSLGYKAGAFTSAGERRATQSSRMLNSHCRTPKGHTRNPEMQTLTNSKIAVDRSRRAAKLLPTVPHLSLMPHPDSFSPSPSSKTDSLKTHVERTTSSVTREAVSGSKERQPVHEGCALSYIMQQNQQTDDNSDIRNFILTARHGTCRTVVPSPPVSDSSSSISCSDVVYPIINEHDNEVKSVKSIRSDPGSWRHMKKSLLEAKKRRENLQKLLINLHDTYGEQGLSKEERSTSTELSASPRSKEPRTSTKIKSMRELEKLSRKTRSKGRDSESVVSCRIPFLYLDQSDGRNGERDDDEDSITEDELGPSMHCNFDLSKH